MKGMRKAMGGGVETLFNNSRVLNTLNDDAKQMMQIQIVPIHRVNPNHEQPRKQFAEESMLELVQSIEQHGLLQPLVVKPNTEVLGTYHIIAGERRYRAAKQVGMKEIPVIIHDVERKEAFILALTENMQREALNPLEEAHALLVLKDNFAFTQEELAKTLGKSRTAIANILRLMNLYTKAKQALQDNAITFGHAKVLLGAPDETVQDIIVDAVLKCNLSVRDTEVLLDEYIRTYTSSQEKQRKRNKKNASSEQILALATRLSSRLSTKIQIKGSENKGSIVIQFSSKEMLDGLLGVLERE